MVTGKVDVRGATERLPNEVEEPEPLDDVEAVTNAEDLTVPEEAEA